MRKINNRFWKNALAALLAGTLILTAGCGSSGASSSDSSADASSSSSASSANSDASQVEAASNDSISDEDTITLAISEEINNLDIIHAYGVDFNLILNSIAEGLFYYDYNSQIQPWLAESYEQPDDTTYVYKIKEGVNFSDGTPLTADDVVFSLTRQSDPEVGGELSWMFANVESIEKTGDYEVTVKLINPDATWQETLATTASLVVSKAYYEAHPDDFGKPGVAVIGSGAYTIESWNQGEQIVLVENENYWNKEAAPDFKKAVIKSISDPSVVKLSLEQGDLDYASWLSVDTAKELEGNSDISLQAPYAFAENYLSFNNSREGLDDINLHKAIAYGIDKQSIVDNLYTDKYAKVGTGLPYGEANVTIAVDEWTDYFANVEKYEYNTEKAKEYLEKSSYQEGTPLVLKYNSESSNDESVALVVQQNLAEIGINIQLEGVSRSEVFTLRYGGTETRDFDLLITGWGSDYPDPAGAISPMFVSTNNGPGGSNWFEYKNEKFDELLYASNYELDEVKRAKLLQEATDILVDELPGVTLYYQNEIFALSNRVDYQISSSLLYNIYLREFKKAE